MTARYRVRPFNAIQQKYSVGCCWMFPNNDETSIIFDTPEEEEDLINRRGKLFNARGTLEIEDI